MLIRSCIGVTEVKLCIGLFFVINCYSGFRLQAYVLGYLLLVASLKVQKLKVTLYIIAMYFYCITIV